MEYEEPKDGMFRFYTAAGMYESNSFIGLLLEILWHRTWHLFKHGKWTD